MKERPVQLEPQTNSDAIEQVLRRSAERRYGAERARALESRLQNTARWMARIAAAPVEFAVDPPDQSGVGGDNR
jgi:hypothetical protein